ncbi:MAG TPA: TIGR04282 family arsenosugar biosynthesis glycosyltransferase [Burkholderiaceae bacterium]|jgi:rSAM/selenodomain-associated transferase 1|nr:TIGR04282 family arsenosugar biosynthesis glycosyltransferase [Burkholderiaceae bacterium]HQR70883.1 TIGR04282 family arsenosugar biosynthesis glycosyltransferase [Burkholderiaceae bacterium]
MRGWQIAVLARTPVPGQVKTRLISRLGAVRAAELQAHLTERALQRAREACAHVALWLDGPADSGSEELARRFGAELLYQPDGDLGQRMLAAVRYAHALDMDSILIGTDCPAQAPDDLRQARTRLARSDVVLQPAHDGGYVLIGIREPHPELFTDIEWGSDKVLDATRRRCVGHGLRLAELHALPDLDRPDDLEAAFAAGALDRARWS